MKELSSKQLAVDLIALDIEIGMMKAEREAIIRELQDRHTTAISTAYKDASKDHGKVSVPIAGNDGGFELDAEIRQTVTWDQVLLNGAAMAMHPEEARAAIKIDLSVPEKIYNALLPGTVKDALTAARTTKLSAPLIKVRFPKQEK